jgi:AbrB family looped-hinge helix DNA binding protein
LVRTQITTKGQVTIPQEVRERSGRMPGTDVVIEAGVVRLVKAALGGSRRTRGQTLVESLQGHGDFKTSTDEIVAPMRPSRAPACSRVMRAAMPVTFRRFS